MDTNLQYDTDQDLIRRIALGDENAFTGFYRKYSPKVFKVAMTYTERNISQSEEFVQVVFIKIWENRHRLTDIERAEDYLFILARNLIFDHFKKRANEFILHRSQEHSPEYRTPAHLLEAREYSQLYHKAIDQLPAQQKLVYELAKVEGIPHEDIAARTGLTINTVRTHLKLATRSVRHYIAIRLPDPLILSAAVLEIIFSR